MFTTLLALLNRTTEPVQTEDGACAACDHPFGQMNHFCFGPLSVAS